MIATFWEKLFELADDAKEKDGLNSVRYKTIHEIEDILQDVYDSKNKITEEVLEATPKSKADELVFNIRQAKVTDDGEGYWHYELDSMHFDTASEVLGYMIEDRNDHYRSIFKEYDKALAGAVEQTAADLFNKACEDFHKALGDKKPKCKICRIDNARKVE